MIKPPGKEGPEYRYFIPPKELTSLIVSKDVRKAVSLYVKRRNMSTVEATFLLCAKGFKPNSFARTPR